MVVRARRLLCLGVLGLVLVAGAGAVVASYSAYGCLPEGRTEVFKNFTLPVSGTLVLDARTRSAVTIRDCELTKVELLSSIVRFRAEGGAYHVVVHLADGARHEYWLTPGDPDAPRHVTRWYGHDQVAKLSYTGVSHDGTVSTNELPRRAATPADWGASDLQRGISSVTISTPSPRAVSPLFAKRL